MNTLVYTLNHKRSSHSSPADSLNHKYIRHMQKLEKSMVHAAQIKRLT